MKFIKLIKEWWYSSKALGSVTPITPWIYGTPSPMITPTIPTSSVRIPSLPSKSSLATDANGTIIAGSGGASTLADISLGSTDATKSLYTMTSTIPVEFKTSDAHTLLYLNETNGRVGIGTTNPGEKLEVAGNLKVGGVTGGYYLDVLDSTGAKHFQIVTSATNATLAVNDGGTNAISILHSNGNVGIGTTSPGQKLVVAGNAIVGDGTGGTNLTVTGSSGNLTVADGSIIDTTRSALYLAYSPKIVNINNGAVVINGGTVGLNGNNAGFAVADRGGATNTFTVYNFAGLFRIYDGSDRLTIAQTTGNVTLPTGTLTVSGAGNSSFVGNVGIGTTAPNANAILDITSTTKAFMPPRMTTTQRDAIASPTEGMVIYNLTTHNLDFHNGTSWAGV